MVRPAKPLPLTILCPCLCLLLCLWVGPTARAQDDDETPAYNEPETGDYTERWTGTFYGIGAFAGPQLLGNGSLDDTLGLAIGAKLRVSLVMHLFDFQLAYVHARSDAMAGDVPLSITTDGISASAGIHPGFLAILMSPTYGYFFASIYFLIGASLEHASFEWDDASFDQDWETGFHVGAGFDYPITSPETGWALWVGFQYRWNTFPTERGEIAPFNDSSLRQHWFLFRLSLRINGLPL